MMSHLTTLDIKSDIRDLNSHSAIILGRDVTLFEYARKKAGSDGYFWQGDHSVFTFLSVMREH